MEAVRLYSDEQRDWVEQYCKDYTVLDYVIDPSTFEKVAYKIQFCTESDSVMFKLRWL